MDSPNGGSKAPPATVLGFLTGVPAKSPEAPVRRRRRKKADEKGMKQLDLRQMQHSPSKQAAAAAIRTPRGQSEQEVIVIRDDGTNRAATAKNAGEKQKKMSLRAGSRRKEKGQRHAQDSDAAERGAVTTTESGTRENGAGVDGINDALSSGYDVSTLSSSDGIVAGHAIKDDDKENRTGVEPQGWILRPGARQKASIRRPVRAAGGDSSGTVIACGDVASGNATGTAPLKRQRSRRNIRTPVDVPEDQTELQPSNNAGSAATTNGEPNCVDCATKLDASAEVSADDYDRERGRTRRAKARKQTKSAALLQGAVEEEVTSDVTTPTSSQDDSENGSASRRRSGRLKLKHDAQVTKEQEARRRAEEQLAQRDSQPEDSSEGQSSPGEHGWMWKRKVERKNRTSKGRLASLKPKGPPVASLSFSSDSAEPPPTTALQDKLVLRLKVPPDLQAELRALIDSPVKKIEKLSISPLAPPTRPRAEKQQKRKREERAVEIENHKLTDAATATAIIDENTEPQRKRRRGKQVQLKAKPGTAEKKSKNEGVELQSGVGQEFFMTKEQREAHRQAKLKERLKKQTEESKKVDLKLTQGKSAHPFLVPRKLAPASITTSANTSLRLCPSTTIPLLPLPPPVPNHIIHLAPHEELFLSSLVTSAGSFKTPINKFESTVPQQLLEGTLLFHRISDMQANIASEKPTAPRRTKRTVPSEHDETMIARIIEAIHALFPTNDNQTLPTITEVSSILQTYKTKSVISDASAQLWSDRYRARCTREIIGYGQQMMLLNGWLQRWKGKDSGEPTKKPKGRRKAREHPEVDTNHANLLLIQGATGAGKTAAVYACAEELGFRVLEINPSVERTGAHIKHLIEEATQSRNVVALSSAMGATAEFASVSPTSVQSSGDTNSARCSLVLFEEVDVVFSSDKGFFAALRELLRITKTPIVLTCNNLTQELEDLLRDFQHISLILEGVPHAELVLHLQLICLVEGMDIDNVIAQTEEVKHMVEHVGGDVRQSLLALQFWVCGSDSQFNYLSWLGLGDVAKRWRGSLTSLLLPWTNEDFSKPHLEDRLRFADHINVTSLLHCNLFSFFPREGTTDEETRGSIETEGTDSQRYVIGDSGMLAITATPRPVIMPLRPSRAAFDVEKARILMPMMSGLDFLCEALSFHDIVKTEHTKRKVVEHHGMDVTPDALLGGQIDALAAVLELDCLPEACKDDHVEELAVPHKHNRQRSTRERQKEGYDSVYAEVVPKTQHLSRYGGIECFGAAQHIARLDARNRQAKEGRRKQRHVNNLRLKAGQHAWLLRYGFPWVSPSLVSRSADEEGDNADHQMNEPRDEGGEEECKGASQECPDEADADEDSGSDANSPLAENAGRGDEASDENSGESEEEEAEENSNYYDSSAEQLRMALRICPAISGEDESQLVSVEDDLAAGILNPEYSDEDGELEDVVEDKSEEDDENEEDEDEEEVDDEDEDDDDNDEGGHA